MKLQNREISWLSFNERVLQEAGDPSVPLLERLKFLGIFSSNLDEFFRVRVATLRRMLSIGGKAKKIIGDHPKSVLAKIYDTVVHQQQKFESIYAEIIDELELHNVYIVDESEITEEQGKYVSEYFHKEVRPALVPIMIDSVDEFPYLKDRAIYFAVLLYDSTLKHKPRYSLIEIPTDVVGRFLVLPESDGKKYVMLIDDVIRYSLKNIFYIFPHDTHTAYTVKMTRDAELDIDTDLTESLVEKIQKSVKQRSYGKPVRLVYDQTMPPDLLKYLLRRIQLHDKKDNLIPAGRYHNFKDFIKFPVLGLSHLTYPVQPSLYHPAFPPNTSMMQRIKQADVLLHIPYHSFDYVIDFLREAAIDPRVESIKMTLYRLAPRSMIGNALINAAKNGKQVTVVMELQARFDEENNILWSDKLSEEGVKVFPGVQGLKVHSKTCLITRKEKGKKVLYANVGTGNYNEITARVYADHSLFTCDRRITEEIEGLFNFLESTYKIVPFKHLLTAPFQMRKKFLRMIDDEIEHAKHGKPAAMWIKLNNLMDTEMVEKIAEAANKGVKVKMIVRSTCALFPNQIPGSENIRITSIVDKFLEHSRIIIFHNNGDEKYYISSADWMMRNLNNRVETACPIYDKQIQHEIKMYFELQLMDNLKARIINDAQDNQYAQTESPHPLRSQEEIYNYFSETGSNYAALSSLTED